MDKITAKKTLRRLRAAGHSVKLYRVSRVYTQPGKGLAVAMWYEVR